MQVFEFVVTITAATGGSDVVTLLIPDTPDDGDWSREPERARRDLDRLIRDRLQLPW